MLFSPDSVIGSLVNFSSAVPVLRKLIETTAGWREVKAFAGIYWSGGRDREFII